MTRLLATLCCAFISFAVASHATWVVDASRGSRGTLDASGKFFWSIPVPRDKQLLGLGLVWQGTAGPTLNRLVLSNPAAYVHGR